MYPLEFTGNVWGLLIAVIMLINTWLTYRNGQKAETIRKDVSGVKKKLARKARL